VTQGRFQKIARERAQREKADAKRERREAAQAAAREAPTDQPVVDQSAVLAGLAELHQQFEAGTIDFEVFEQRKQELMASLDV
jgi:hypothetical protein